MRGRLTVTVLSLAVALLAVAPGLALAAAGHEGAKQPDVLEPRFDLTIWTIVVFGLLYLVLRYVKLPGASAPAFVMMLEGLRNREQAIQGALNEATKARDEAHQLREQFQREMDKAHEQVRGLLDEARRDAQKATDDMIGKARSEIQAERDRLRREIDTARDQALQDLWGQAAKLATLVSAKAIQRHISPEDHRRLVDEAVAELKQAGNQRRRDVA